MSDAAITTICTCIIQVGIGLITFLTLWVKLKYGVEPKAAALAAKTDVVEKKLDANTLMTTDTKEAVSNGALAGYEDRFVKHDIRLSTLETKFGALETKFDALSRNVDSSRHEMRGNFQTLMNKLDLNLLASSKSKAQNETTSP